MSHPLSNRFFWFVVVSFLGILLDFFRRRRLHQIMRKNFQASEEKLDRPWFRWWNTYPEERRLLEKCLGFSLPYVGRTAYLGKDLNLRQIHRKKLLQLMSDLESLQQRELPDSEEFLTWTLAQCCQREDTLQVVSKLS